MDPWSSLVYDVPQYCGKIDYPMYYVYILKSQSTDNYYIGCTNNLERRIGEHNNDKSLYTRKRGPWKIVYFEKYSSLKNARQRELNIKNKKRKSYVEWLINNRGPVV